MISLLVFYEKQVIRPTALTVQNGSFTTLLGPFGRGKADAAASVISEQSLPPVPVKAAGTLCRDSQILMIFLVSIPLRSFALSPYAAMFRIFLAFARERKYHLLWESCAESAIKNEALL